MINYCWLAGLKGFFIFIDLSISIFLTDCCFVAAWIVVTNIWSKLGEENHLMQTVDQPLWYMIRQQRNCTSNNCYLSFNQSGFTNPSSVIPLFLWKKTLFKMFEVRKLFPI